MKEQMQLTKEEKTLDLTQFPRAVVEQYELMLKLAGIVKEEYKGVMPTNSAIFVEKYLANYAKLSTNPASKIEDREVSK